MCSRDGASLAWTSSPVTPSIAAAATDRSRTSSLTLVRSVNTGVSHNCRMGRAGGPGSVTHEHVVSEAPACNHSGRAVTPYRLGGRIVLDGELNTVISFVLEDGRISRMYAVRNPDKPSRLDEEAALAR